MFIKIASIRRLSIIFPLLIALTGRAQSDAGKLATAYNQARANAIKQVNQRYIQQAESTMKLYMQASDLQHANAAREWLKRLSDEDETNDMDGIAPNAGSPDRLVSLQTRYLKERSDAVTRVDGSYLSQVELLQRQSMQRSDLDSANALAGLLTKIKAELEINTASALGASSEALFAPEKQTKWKIKQGKWKWDGTKLVGAGDSRIEYPISLMPPFVVQFKINVKDGTRERLTMGKVGIANIGYGTKFGPQGGDEQKLFNYEHNHVYRCTLIVTRKQSGFYVDGNYITNGNRQDKKVDSIVLNAGDGWSSGTVEWQDLVIFLGTDKVAFP